jgi:hypothetical protein
MCIPDSQNWIGKERRNLKKPLPKTLRMKNTSIIIMQKRSCVVVVRVTLCSTISREARGIKDIGAATEQR